MKEIQKRILNFDPTEVYQRIEEHLNRYKRINSVSTVIAFPCQKDKTCACGCGEILKGRRTRWAKDECRDFAYHVISIINGHHELIKSYLNLIYGGWACTECGVADIYREQKNGMAVDLIHKDHILAVKNGGGGCWLDGYRPLCNDCHINRHKND